MSLKQQGDNKISLQKIEPPYPPVIVDVDWANTLLKSGSLFWEMRWGYKVPAGVDHVGRRDSRRKVNAKWFYQQQLRVNLERLNANYMQRPK